MAIRWDKIEPGCRREGGVAEREPAGEILSAKREGSQLSR